MKRIAILFFALLCASSVHSQTHLQGGDLCFDRGDYTCAVTKYSEAFRLASGRDKQVAEIKLTRAKFCQDHIKAANLAFSNRQYAAAKVEYQSVLDSNPKDSYAQSQLEKCNRALNPVVTLSVSKENLSFPASGGSENITVSTNKSPYSVNLLPSWCTLQKYSGYFIINCSANVGTNIRNGYFMVAAGDKTVRINISQPGKEEIKTETSLSVSKGNLSFPSGGGSENITVVTNKDSYSINLLPTWCSVKKYSGYFIISCSANSSVNVRNDFFTVNAEDKTARINVSQLGNKQDTKTETTLSVTKSGLWFSSSGGRSENIKVFSNAPSYSVSLVPSWLKVETHNGFIVVVCSANNSNVSRSGWFKVTAVEKELRIIINQEGVKYRNLNSPSSSNRNYSQTKTKKSFNSPKTKDTWGLTFGYVNYDFGEGPQFGVKAEPLFQYGFGLNTGINFEAYSDDAWSAFTEWKFQEYAVNIPLQLEYRLNFSKQFNIFFYGGAGFYAITDPDFINYSLPVTFDFGGGFRVSHFQVNVGRNLYLGDFKAIDSFGENIQPYQNYSVLISYMF